MIPGFGLLIGLILFYWYFGRDTRSDVQRQLEEDTCATHGIFCCSKCFNVEPDYSVDLMTALRESVAKSRTK